MTPEQLTAALAFGLAAFAVGWNMGLREGVLKGRLEEISRAANTAGTSTDSEKGEISK